MDNVKEDNAENEPAITAIPLLAPADGVPKIIADEASFESAICELAEGSGPFAVDAERASGFKFSARAYLIQIKRNGGGLHLVDPIPFGPNHPLFIKLNELLPSALSLTPVVPSKPINRVQGVMTLINSYLEKSISESTAKTASLTKPGAFAFGFGGAS